MKKIEPKMVEFLDKKLAENGLAQLAITNKDARTLFRLAAQACVGIRETGGNNAGPMVELIQETIGGNSREAWCMSFVQTCLAYAEVKTGVKSPVHVSEGCAQVWEGTDKKQRVKLTPAPGAIIIWGKYNKKGGYLGGHTGVVDHVDGQYFFAIEGNTTSGVTGSEEVVRDGGGCYYTKRRFAGSGNMKVRGFIKPF